MTYQIKNSFQRWLHYEVMKIKQLLILCSIFQRLIGVVFTVMLALARSLPFVRIDWDTVKQVLGDEYEQLVV
jgi:hypothetical protein